MHVDSSGAAEKVVPPHFLQQLLSRKHTAGMLDQEAEQFELFIRQIQRGPVNPRSVGGVINNKFTDSDDVRIVDLVDGNWPTGEQEPEARVDFDRRGAGQEESRAIRLVSAMATATGMSG